MIRRFENKNWPHNKFWEVRLGGNIQGPWAVYTRWGKIGTDSAWKLLKGGLGYSEAMRLIDNKASEKWHKGYKEKVVPGQMSEVQLKAAALKIKKPTYEPFKILGQLGLNFTPKLVELLALGECDSTTLRFKNLEI